MIAVSLEAATRLFTDSKKKKPLHESVVGSSLPVALPEYPPFQGVGT
jgi:hypothetical protein